jgi:dihydroflavonol-4-reductase
MLQSVLAIIRLAMMTYPRFPLSGRFITFVLHVASPFVLAEPRNENDLIAPAVEGTKRVIAAAQRAGVKRLVLTSSIAAISSGKDNGRYGPDAWSDTSARIGAYAKSKTLAERAAWKAAKGGDMNLRSLHRAPCSARHLARNLRARASP